MRPSRFVLSVSFVLWSLTSAGGATLVEEYTAGMEARGEGRMVDYHAAMLRAHAAQPGHAILQIHLARAAAGIGATEEAANWMRRALGQGAWVDVAEDEWLAPLRASEFGDEILRLAARVGAHRGRATIGFEYEPYDLLPEGIAHDPSSDRFFLGSVRERRVRQRTADGTWSDFVDPGGDGLTAVLGLHVDAERRRLWAVGVADPLYGDYGEDTVGATAVWCWSLDDGFLVDHWELPPSESRRGFNDVTVLADGAAAITDAFGGTVLRVRVGEDGFDEVVAPGTLRGPNGIAPADDGRHVYVAEYVYGVVRVDLESGDVEQLGHPEGVSLIGIDGLVVHDGALIAVQNYAGLDRAARFPLAADGASVVDCEVLDARHPRLDDPTTGVVVDGTFWYIANSHIAGFDREAGPRPIEEWTPGLVLRVDLDDTARGR